MTERERERGREALKYVAGTLAIYILCVVVWILAHLSGQRKGFEEGRIAGLKEAMEIQQKYKAEPTKQNDLSIVDLKPGESTTKFEFYPYTFRSEEK